MRTGQPNCTRLRLVAGAFCIDATKRHDERADQRDYQDDGENRYRTAVGVLAVTHDTTLQSITEAAKLGQA